MQKAKSPTLKKSDKEIVDYGLQRVKEWTKKELTELQKNSKIPLAVELANGDYIVATFKIHKVSPVCWKVDELDFTDRCSAILYCAFSHLLKYSEAREIYALDGIVGKLDVDKAMFRVRLDKAHEVGDQFKIDLYSSRYEDAKVRLQRAKQDLEKIINAAKYIHDL